MTVVVNIGGFFCLKCGYRPIDRITFNETCDACHRPVKWHDADLRDALESLLSENAALKKALEEALSENAALKADGK